MRVGAIVPNDGECPARLGIPRMARAAEDAGAEGVWVSDHLLLVDEPTEDYPYSADGALTWRVDVDYYEALASCVAMAMATKTCRIGTAVLVLPQRNVLEVAKAAATIDRLSASRLALGVGAGWNRREFEALGYVYATRGKRLDEMLSVLRDCWSGRPAGFQGSEVHVPPEVVLYPRPVRPAGPPLLVGGMSAAARRRAATLGDGWLAIAFADRWDPDALRAQLEDVRSRRRDVGAEGRFEAVLKLHSGFAELDRLPELVAETRRIGFDEVIVDPPWTEGIDAAAEAIGRAREA